MDKTKLDSLRNLSFGELIARANRARSDSSLKRVELCNIMNAKSGSCSQDCRFCAQSGRHKTGVNTYPLKSKAEMIEAAQGARDMGAERFDIVTSGERLSQDELKRVSDAISEITQKIGIKICASLGSLKVEDFILLKQAGLSRYHHNIETSPRYFKEIVTTHTFQDRLDTIKAAKSSGLEVCSGGIIGMGEEEEDRIEMAFLLKELGVDSVPINVLVPIKGTPFEGRKTLSCFEIIRTIALFRIILKDKIIKIAAGRESVLKDFQAMAFMAGANGMLIGGYLTIKGRSVSEDLKLVEEVEKLWNQ